MRRGHFYGVKTTSQGNPAEARTVNLIGAGKCHRPTLKAPAIHNVEPYPSGSGHLSLFLRLKQISNVLT